MDEEGPDAEAVTVDGDDEDHDLRVLVELLGDEGVGDAHEGGDCEAVDEEVGLEEGLGVEVDDEELRDRGRWVVLPARSRR